MNALQSVKDLKGICKMFRGSLVILFEVVCGHLA